MGQSSRAVEQSGTVEYRSCGAEQQRGAAEQAPSFCPFALVSLEHGL